MVNREVVVAVLRQEFEREEQANFARLAKIPDTLTSRFLEYYRTLETSEADRLKSALARRGAEWFLPSDPPPLGLRELDPALERCLDATQRLAVEWRFNSLKLLKMTVGWVRSEHPRAKAEMQHVHIPAETIRWVEGLTTCKAAELRKLVKLAFHSRFGLKPENDGGGVWRYRHPTNSQPFHVEIDYGGTWGQQLRYGIHIENPLLPRRLQGMQYETLLGAGGGDWDFITTGNADQSLALLCDLIQDTVDLANRVLTIG
jgi:hypothetical protein